MTAFEKMTPKQAYQYADRVLRLTAPPRMMTTQAAIAVVEAAMFGEGCIEGEVRARIQAEGNQ